jgi:outer membrane protein assembly factor BamB
MSLRTRHTAAAAAGLLLAAAPSALAADFRTFQANPAHDGHVRGESFRPPLKRLWARDLGGSASYPIIAGNRIFLTVANRGYSGTSLIALDALTGRTLWSRPAAGNYRWSNATYGNGKLFHLSDTGELTAHRPSTGAKLWSTRVGNPWAAPPTAADDSVYVSAHSDAWFTVPEEDSTPGVYAIRQSNGAVRWSRPVMTGDASSPTLGKDRLFVNYGCGQVYAFHRRTGATAWHFNSGCAGGGGQTTTLYRGELWTREVSGRQDPIVYDAATGKPLRHFPYSTDPAFANGIGYFGRSLRVDATRAGGEPVWRFSIENFPMTPPLVVGRTVYFGADRGVVRGLAAGTGKTRWKDATGALFAGDNTSSAGQPTNGLGAGRGLLIAPNAKGVVAYAAKRGTMNCRRVAAGSKRARCRIRDLPLFAGHADARLARSGTVRAAGSARVRHGAIRLSLDRDPGAGQYTLELAHAPGSVTRRFGVTLAE